MLMRSQLRVSHHLKIEDCQGSLNPDLFKSTVDQKKTWLRYMSGQTLKIRQFLKFLYVSQSTDLSHLVDACMF